MFKSWLPGGGSGSSLDMYYMTIFVGQIQHPPYLPDQFQAMDFMFMNTAKGCSSNTSLFSTSKNKDTIDKNTKSRDNSKM